MQKQTKLYHTQSVQLKSLSDLTNHIAKTVSGFINFKSASQIELLAGHGYSQQQIAGLLGYTNYQTIQQILKKVSEETK